MTSGSSVVTVGFEQSDSDVIKIAINGTYGNYVLCVNKNKKIELYDRTKMQSVWTIGG